MTWEVKICTEGVFLICAQVLQIRRRATPPFFRYSRKQVGMGVFQGSALGPLLFTIFSNNLSLNAEDAAVFQYADDTKVFVSGPARDIGALISPMEASLASLNDWFCANALTVNASKTQLIVFGGRQNLRKLPYPRVSFRDAVLQLCA